MADTILSEDEIKVVEFLKSNKYTDERKWATISLLIPVLIDNVIDRHKPTAKYIPFDV